jgi:glutamate N-acetyltransferase / amino-acid N-acetyltransferase
MSESVQSFHGVAGIRLVAAAAGIRYQNRDDLVVMEIAEGAQCAATFTLNAFCAAPVRVAKEHLAATAPRYLLINSGNANAGTGDEGLRACRETCKSLAAVAGCAINQILPFSTGVIGEDLPTEAFSVTLPKAVCRLSADAWPAAAAAIMTTDTRPKLFSRQVEIANQTITLTGMAKGAGMIRPNMATMLAFIATDAAVPQSLLQPWLNQAVDASFNAITIDGDTSTNDACVLVATGASGVTITSDTGEAAEAFTQALNALCAQLARAIVADAEGATKLVSIQVNQAANLGEARQVAFTVAHSPLVKTALFASDPNWGRILAAVGRAGVEGLNIDGVSIHLDDVCIVRDGGRDPDYREAAGAAVFAQSEFSIRIGLHRGQASAEVLTSDLSFDYVKINAEYRT